MAYCDCCELEVKPEDNPDCEYIHIKCAKERNRRFDNGMCTFCNNHPLKGDGWTSCGGKCDYKYLGYRNLN